MMRSNFIRVGQVVALSLLVQFFSLTANASPKAGDESDGTKGTIGFVCVNLSGERITWLASPQQPVQPIAFSNCMNDVLKHFKNLSELGNGQEFTEKMSKWFMSSYRNFVNVGERLGCERDLREDWKRRILDGSTTVAKPYSADRERPVDKSDM